MEVEQGLLFLWYLREVKRQQEWYRGICIRSEVEAEHCLWLLLLSNLNRP